jgi:hypothetical protein
MHRRTLGRLGAVAVLAAAVGAGIAYAAIPDTTGAVNACYSTTTGALRAVDPPGCAGGEAPVALGGPTRGWANSISGLVSLTTTSSTVAKLDLPAGRYLIHGKVKLINLSAGTAYIPCSLRLAGTTTWLDASALRLASSANVGGIALQASVTLTTPRTVELICAAVPDTTPVSVRAEQRQLDAIQLDALTVTFS